jgi:hypothetical protein
MSKENLMDLNFGHGFTPRLGEENYKAVDRCIGPADLFTQTELNLPWAIVDGAWAAGRPELLDTLREHRTSTWSTRTAGGTGTRRRSTWRSWRQPVGARRVP